MKLETLKDLEKLVKLCRKLGVETITVDGVALVLGSAPLVASSKKSPRVSSTSIPGVYINDTTIETDGLSDEDLLFYSAGTSDPNFESQ